MKRLAPLLILWVFCLGSMGGRVFLFHHHLPKNAADQGGRHFSLYLSTDDTCADLDSAAHPCTLPNKLALDREPCREELPGGYGASATSQRHDYHPGLGCGGLPA